MNKSYIVVLTVVLTAVFVWLGFLTSIVMTREFMEDPRLTYLDEKINLKEDKAVAGDMDNAMMEDDSMMVDKDMDASAY